MKTTTFFQLDVPKPCSVGWNNMTPDERGAFCSVCSKSLWDFTNKTPEEIKGILIREAANKPCGRFRASQLQHTELTIPIQVLRETRMSPLSRFAVATLIVFGASLFSFTSAQGQVMQIDTAMYLDSLLNRIEQMQNDSSSVIVRTSVRMIEEERVYLEGVPHTMVELSKPTFLERMRWRSRWRKYDREKKREARGDS